MKFLAGQPRRLLLWVQAALIVAAGCFIYAPAFRGERLWDDKLDFPVERLPFNGHGLAQLLSGKLSLDYLPIKAGVQWLEWRLWHENTLGFHLVNLGFHLLGALLLWRLLSQLTRPGLGPWLGGLLFAVHPLAVESVAWMTELKNVLSLPPLLLAMSAFVEFDRRPRARPYLLALGWFVAAMFCKTSVVMLPVLLALYCWWRHGRLGGREWRRLAPFFTVSLLLGLVAIAYQGKASGTTVFPHIGLAARVAAAGIAPIFYFSKSVLPVHLLPLYPRWPLETLRPAEFVPWLVLAAVGAWLWRRQRAAVSGADWIRPGLFGLGCFAVNLLPVLGLIPMGYQHVSWMADHFAYLSLASLVGLVAVALPQGEFGPVRPRGDVVLGITALLVALALTSRREASAFRSEEALWTHTLRSNPSAWLPHNSLGLTYARTGRREQAIAEFKEALRLRPGYSEAHSNLGLALQEAGDLAGAEAHFQASLEADPASVEAASNWGNSLSAQHRLPEAIARYRQALAIDPELSAVHFNLGLALRSSGDEPAALAEFATAFRLRPDLPVFRKQLAATQLHLCAHELRQGHTAAAIGHAREAVQLEPASAAARNDLGTALALGGQLTEAVSQLRRAVELDPTFAGARDNLSRTLQAQARRGTVAVPEATSPAPR